MKRILSIALASFAAIAPSLVLADDEVDHTRYCLSDAADSTIFEQAAPFPRTLCKAIVAGAAYGGALQYIGNSTQSEWTREYAAKLACDINPQNQLMAVFLVAACQCHNEGAAKQVMNGKYKTIRHLRQYAGCDNLGIPVIPN